MKLKPKFKKILFVLSIITFLSAGCGGSSAPAAKPVTLNIWDPFLTSDDMSPLISAYTQKHPNVHIIFSKKDINTYSQDLLNALASGTGPDIYSINNAWLPQYMDKVISSPTSTTFTYKYYKDSFVDVAMDDFVVNQKIYGVPLSIDSLALYYNKDILGTYGIATPPKTWDELSADVQKIKRADRTGYFTLSGLAAGTNANVNRAVDIVYLFMLQKGVMPYGGNGGTPSFAQGQQVNGNFVNPGLDGLNYYTSFANPTSLNYNWNARSDYSIDAFANGRAAFLYSYSYTAASLRQKNPNLNFDVAPVPQPNLDNPAVNFANYWGYVVSKQTKSPNTAWDFLQSVTTKTSLDAYYAKNKQPASRRDLIALQISDPDIGVFANANLTAKSFYRVDQLKVDNIFGQMIDNIILNGMPAKDALGQAQTEASAINLQNNN